MTKLCGAVAAYQWRWALREDPAVFNPNLQTRSITDRTHHRTTQPSPRAFGLASGFYPSNPLLWLSFVSFVSFVLNRPSAVTAVPNAHSPNRYSSARGRRVRQR